MKPSEPKKLTADLSPFGAWAFALGSSVGWGSLVVTSNAYLVKAGPAGSVLGMIAGTLIIYFRYILHKDQESL